MNRYSHILVLAAIAPALAVSSACGGESTALGTVKDHGGNAGAAGAEGAGAAGGVAGAAADSGNDGSAGAGGSGEGGASGAGGSGAGTSGGASGSGTGGGATGSGGQDSGVPCVPKPPPIPNPSPQEQERAQLIHAYCVTLARDDCLDDIGGHRGVSDQAKGCSLDERIVACEQDRLFEYLWYIPAACHGAWSTAIRCAADEHYGLTCGVDASLISWALPTPCESEKQALLDCRNLNQPPNTVTGTRATCTYWPGGIAPCEVSCDVEPNDYALECGGPSGLPLHCACSVNGHMLVDFKGTRITFYASDCREAATRAANGECVNGLDCCFEYFDGQKQACGCGSDLALVNAPSCQAAADAVGGNVVAICPQYVDGSGGGCWPPGTCGD